MTDPSLSYGPRDKETLFLPLADLQLESITVAGRFEMDCLQPLVFAVNEQRLFIGESTRFTESFCCKITWNSSGFACNSGRCCLANAASSARAIGYTSGSQKN